MMKVTIPAKIARGELQARTLRDFPFTSQNSGDWYSYTYDRDQYKYADLPLHLRWTAICYYRFIDCLARAGIVKNWSVS